MLHLAARWATKAASRAAAALWDWMHVQRTCCHQGEIDWGSHDSSTAPNRKEEQVVPLLSLLLSFHLHWLTDARKSAHTGHKHIPVMLLRAMSSVCRFLTVSFGFCSNSFSLWSHTLSKRDWKKEEQELWKWNYLKSGNTKLNPKIYSWFFYMDVFWGLWAACPS